MRNKSVKRFAHRLTYKSRNGKKLVNNSRNKTRKLRYTRSYKSKNKRNNTSRNNTSRNRRNIFIKLCKLNNNTSRNNTRNNTRNASKNKLEEILQYAKGAFEKSTNTIRTNKPYCYIGNCGQSQACIYYSALIHGIPKDDIFVLGTEKFTDSSTHAFIIIKIDKYYICDLSFSQFIYNCDELTNQILKDLLIKCYVEFNLESFTIFLRYASRFNNGIQYSAIGNYQQTLIPSEIEYKEPFKEPFKDVTEFINKIKEYTSSVDFNYNELYSEEECKDINL